VVVSFPVKNVVPPTILGCYRRTDGFAVANTVLQHEWGYAVVR